MMMMLAWACIESCPLTCRQVDNTANSVHAVLICMFFPVLTFPRCLLQCSVHLVCCSDFQLLLVRQPGTQPVGHHQAAGQALTARHTAALCSTGHAQGQHGGDSNCEQLQMLLELGEAHGLQEAGTTSATRCPKRLHAGSIRPGQQHKRH